MPSLFEDLEVWKKACRLAIDIYQTFEKSDSYALKNQIERAAISIPSNIAEGQERDTKPDFIRFLRIAKGSNSELRTQLYIAAKLNLIETNKSNELIETTKEIARMLQGLITSLRVEKNQLATDNC